MDINSTYNIKLKISGDTLDGEIQSSEKMSDSIINELSNDEPIMINVEENNKKGIYLTIVGVGRENLKNDRMEKMADKGNGNYFYLDSIREGKKIFVEELRRNIFIFRRYDRNIFIIF